MTEKYPPALRISQLDALELDRSLVELLTSQLQLCLKHKVLGKNVSSVEPHLRALLCGALLYKTLWKSGVTVGQKLLSLRYVSNFSRQQLPWQGSKMYSYFKGTRAVTTSDFCLRKSALRSCCRCFSRSAGISSPGIFRSCAVSIP